MALFFATADASSEAPRRLNFDVFLDERPIGFQHFDLQPTRDGVRVVTQAEFQVKVLRITVFEYDHRNEELWSGRCLQAIESTTNSNGTPYRVSGRAGEAGFVLGGGGPGRRIDECVGTFAYWDPASSPVGTGCSTHRRATTFRWKYDRSAPEDWRSAGATSPWSGLPSADATSTSRSPMRRTAANGWRSTVGSRVGGCCATGAPTDIGWNSLAPGCASR